MRKTTPAKTLLYVSFAIAIASAIYYYFFGGKPLYAILFCFIALSWSLDSLYFLRNIRKGK